MIEPVNKEGTTRESTGSALGIRIAAATVVLLAVMFGLYWGGRKLLIDRASEQETGVTQCAGRVYTNIDDAIREADTVCELQLSNSNLQAIPSEIAMMPNLTKLDVSQNQITALPTELAFMAKLEEINASENQLTDLPQEIAFLASLRRLDVSKNKLRRLPREIAFLAALRDFDVSDNELTTFPPEISFLARLERFDASNNQLKTLPIADISLLRDVREIDLSGNSFLETDKQELSGILPQTKF